MANGSSGFLPQSCQNQSLPVACGMTSLAHQPRREHTSKTFTRNLHIGDLSSLRASRQEPQKTCVLSVEDLRLPSFCQCFCGKTPLPSGLRHPNLRADVQHSRCIRHRVLNPQTRLIHHHQTRHTVFPKISYCPLLIAQSIIVPTVNQTTTRTQNLFRRTLTAHRIFYPPSAHRQRPAVA